VLRITILCLVFFCNTAWSCGEESKYSPLLEVDDREKLYRQMILYIPKNIGVDVLQAVHFQIGDSEELVLPIQFYASGEFPDIHRDGYASIMYTSTLENISRITVHAHYKYPSGLNGKISLCIHTEKFKLDELL